MVLHHLTGDDRWLDVPYAPTRARGLSDHDTGGLPEHVQAEIRQAAEHAVRDWSRGAAPASPQPSPEHLQHLLSVCVAEDVPADSARLILVDMGFQPDAAPTLDQRPASAAAFLHQGDGLYALRPPLPSTHPCHHT